MPIVLQHRETEQIYTCTLVNHYGLAYYGVKFWEEWEEAQAAAPVIIETLSNGEPNLWQLIEMEENEMKICNVRLRNSTQYQLYWSSQSRKPDARRLEN